MKKKIFIVEDHEDMRFMYRSALQKIEIDVCGETAIAEEALEQIPAAQPDLVIIDISLPGMDGIELVRRLRKTFPTICLFVVTGHAVERYREAALGAGADLIMSKDDAVTLPEKLEELLHI